MENILALVGVKQAAYMLIGSGLTSLLLAYRESRLTAYVDEYKRVKGEVLKMKEDGKFDSGEVRQASDYVVKLFQRFKR